MDESKYKEVGDKIANKAVDISKLLNDNHLTTFEMQLDEYRKIKIGIK